MNAELSMLEASLNQLVERYRRLQEENARLRSELDAARDEQKLLTDKIVSTAERLENLLAVLPEE